MLRGFVIILIVFSMAAIGALLLSYNDREAEPAAIEIAERVRARACVGDVEFFFELINKDSVEFSMKRSELIRERKEVLFSRQKEPDGSSDLRQYIHSTVPELLRVKWEIYETQVKAGASGPICNMDIVRAGNGQKTVKLKFPGGERSTWQFGKVGEEWKIVSIVDVKPLKLLSSNKRRSYAPGKKKKPQKPPEDLAGANTDMAKPDEPGGELLTTQITSDESASMNKAQSGSQNLVPDSLPGDEESASILVEPEESVEPASNRPGNDFRSVSWGMTPLEVKNREGGEPSASSPGLLSYDTYFKGESVKVSYKFSENSLKSGGIIFLNKHPEEIFYVQDYDRRKNELTERYGEPLISEEIWYNRTYEGIADRMGFAVAIGHLKLRTRWKTERSDILLELKSEDYDMTLVVSYHSR